MTKSVQSPWTYFLVLFLADTSMISSLYVKSYLMPDKKRDSKKKSDEVKVYTKADIARAKTRTEHNTFHPRTFSFTKALEYKKITQEIVAERTVHIEVCVVQKYTKKSFVAAKWNSPLSSAVKRLVKERYDLTPCLSIELPPNMKVYSANKMHISHKHCYSSSFPNSRTQSMSCLPSTTSERAASDSDLQGVKFQPTEDVPSIQITVPSEDEGDTRQEDALHEITVVEAKDTGHSSTIN